MPGEDRDKLWHHHNHNTATETVSGVYYLHLPDDVTSYETAGTELAPNGVEGEGKFITEWKTGHWMIYPERFGTVLVYYNQLKIATLWRQIWSSNATYNTTTNG